MTPLFIIVLIIAIIFAIAFFSLRSSSRNDKATFLKSYNALQNLYQDAKRALSQCESAKIAATKQAEFLQETLDAHLAKCNCGKPIEEPAETKAEEISNSEIVPEGIETAATEQPAPAPVKIKPRVSHRRVKK